MGRAPRPPFAPETFTPVAMQRHACLATLLLLAGPSLGQQVLHSNLGSPGSAYAWSIDVIGDVNLDGKPDIVVAAPLGLDSGAGFRVVSGLDGSALYEEPLGSVLLVSRLEDVDADGRPDFLVHSAPFGADKKVSVRSGLDGGELAAFADDPDSGTTMDDVGDVNGDGVPDFVVGHPDWGSYRGRALVLSGQDATPIHVLTGTHGELRTVGRSVAGVDDIDGDGVADFAFAATYLGTHEVRVHSGSDASLLFILSDAASNFGSTLDRGGDVDGDGTPDILVGQRHQHLVAGKLHVYSGATAQRLYTVQGLCEGEIDATFEVFAKEAETLGDLDGDGRDDFGVVSGSSKYLRIYSGADGAHLSTLVQPGHPSANGVTLAGGADFDGDGLEDVVVGQTTYLVPGEIEQRGRVRVYTDVMNTTTGVAYGFGDGNAPCPCGNVGQPGAGCANASGKGAVLRAVGSNSIATDDELFFEGHDLPHGAYNVLIASAQANHGAGLPVFDGLLQVGPGIQRVQNERACSSGGDLWGSGLRQYGGWQAGDTRYFQVWYRDPEGPCGQGANYTNGVEIQFVP